ncbi:hypothetical protein [Hyphomicrobium sp.]|uniref:hypothetical protein n=1 Tax=Hyphomicrobium sp. TaxID=82 RepID=UPI000F9DD0F4|nr:hypothetical protein [Hyphomicrobium sp.]RUP10802.1 MAG: hypothetical protein EKK38_04665 [Hyphomicrobium sp.]
MTRFAKLSGVVLLSSLAVLPGARVSSADEAAVHQVAPLKGITLAVGPKRAIGYYTNTDNACNLTLMLADSYTEAEKAASEPVRIKLTVREGTSANVDALEGSLSFACAKGASTMIIQPIQRVAYNAVAK